MRLNALKAVRVLMAVNDYQRELFNGDIGYILDIDLVGEEVKVEFDGFSHAFAFNELDVLSLAYAITVHKSQGSEYDAVVIPVAHENDVMLKRNLLYTAVTRGRRLVVLVGQISALHAALGRKRQEVRYCGLAPRLRTESLAGAAFEDLREGAVSRSSLVESPSGS